MGKWLFLLTSTVTICAVTVSLRTVWADSCAIGLGQPLSSASIHIGEIGTESGNCADYFRQRARIELGTEKRLSNGISWRLQTDTVSGTSLPRFTWMPSAQGLKVANRALDALHSDWLFAVALAIDGIKEINRSRRSQGSLPLPEDHPLDQVITEVTYASGALVGVVDLGYWETEGNSPEAQMRGMTIDLRQDRLYEKDSCSGDFRSGTNSEPEDYYFRFGDLLNVCDRDTYGKFVRLLRVSAEKAAEQATAAERSAVAECLQHYRRSTLRIDEEGKEEVLAVYLTFEGLAVHNAFHDFSNAKNGNCTLGRSAINPVVIPYRELEPFMSPGRWRDELLRLH